MSTARTMSSFQDSKHYYKKKIIIGDSFSYIIINKTKAKENKIEVTPDRIIWDATVTINWNGIEYAQKIQANKTYHLNARTITEKWIADEDVPFHQAAELLKELGQNQDYFIKHIANRQGDSVIAIKKTPGQPNNIKVPSSEIVWDKRICIEWDGVTYMQEVEPNGFYQLNANTIKKKWIPGPYQPKETPSVCLKNTFDENFLSPDLIEALKKSVAVAPSTESLSASSFKCK